MPLPVTDAETQARHRQRMFVAALSPAVRLQRVFELSAFAREFAWAGARRYAGEAGDAGPDSVRQRFLEQLYGAQVAAWVACRLAAEQSR